MLLSDLLSDERAVHNLKPGTKQPPTMNHYFCTGFQLDYGRAMLLSDILSDERAVHRNLGLTTSNKQTYGLMSATSPICDWTVSVQCCFRTYCPTSALLTISISHPMSTSIRKNTTWSSGILVRRNVCPYPGFDLCLESVLIRDVFYFRWEYVE